MANNLVQFFRDARPDVSVYTLTKNDNGVISGTIPCASLQYGDQALIFGCDQPWAYWQAFRASLQGISTYWLPSFHDPANSIHPLRARLAQAYLRLCQNMGTKVYAQTKYEKSLLEGFPLAMCYLSGHGLPLTIRNLLQKPWIPDPSNPRPIDLLYLGRASLQKGWPIFSALAKSTSLRCEAIIPTVVTNHSANIKIHLNPSDSEVSRLLSQSKLLILPALYESFGIAQVEAVAEGCVVPILGRWPLWDDFSELHWQSLSVTQLCKMCEDICADDLYRKRIQLSQWLYLKQHYIVETPVLPKVL